MTITFEKQEIIVPVRTGDRTSEMTIEALVGLGTGLAYHRQPTYQDIEYGFTLTHITTGLALSDDRCLASNEQEAQRWLEKVSQILDWTLEKDELIKAARKLGGLRKRIEQALQEVCQECV